jgi:hypothetical protein
MKLKITTKYGIPQDQLNYIVDRDTTCVYCGKKMIIPFDAENRADSATIEHLSHRHDWDSIEHFISKGDNVYQVVAICCGACNSSRSDLPLGDWFNKNYCIERNISSKTVSNVVKDYIKTIEDNPKQYK